MIRILLLSSLLLIPLPASAGEATQRQCEGWGREKGREEGYRYGGRLGAQLGRAPTMDVMELQRVIEEHQRSAEHAAQREECRSAGHEDAWSKGFNEGFNVGFADAHQEHAPRPLPVYPEPAVPMSAEGDRNPHAPSTPGTRDAASPGPTTTSAPAGD